MSRDYCAESCGIMQKIWKKGGSAHIVTIDIRRFFLNCPSEAKAVITDRESAAQLHASELADYIPRVLDFLSLYRGSTLRKDLVS